MLLDNASRSGEKGLEGFYDELRRKYPNTFSVAPGLGKAKNVPPRLPQLDGTSAPAPVKPLPGQHAPSTPTHGWTPEGFLSKVEFQKTQSGQTQRTRPVQHYAGPLVIKDSVIIVPSWNTRDPSIGNRRPSIRFPNLRTQVEQNQVALMSKLNPQKQDMNRPNGSLDLSKPPSQTSSDDQYSKHKTSSSGRTIRACYNAEGGDSEDWLRRSTRTSDPLGDIMRELLPNKPGKLMNEPPKESRASPSTDGRYLSERHYGHGLSIYSPSPAKIFRPKMLNPQERPKPSDIIKKFSAKPKPTSGPLKADHTLGKRMQMQVMEAVESVTIYSESTITTNSSKEAGQAARQTPVSRVRFNDESFRAADRRYRDRTLLGKCEEGTMRLKAPATSESTPHLLDKPIEETAKQRPSSRPTEETTKQRPPSRPTEETAKQRPPSPSGLDRTQDLGTQTWAEPSKRTALPPTTPRKAAIAWNPPVKPAPAQEDSSAMGTDGQHLGPPAGRDAASPDGISVNFPIDSWEPSMDLNSKGWPGPGGHNTTVKEVSETSYLYSKVKKTLHTRMQKIPALGSVGFTRPAEERTRPRQSPRLLAEPQDDTQIGPPGNTIKCPSRSENSSSCKSGTSSASIPESLLSHEQSPSWDGSDGGSGQQMLSEQEKKPGRAPSPQERKPGPFSRMLAMQTFLKKGRAKNYLVHIPTPPPPEHRRPCRGPSSATARRLSEAPTTEPTWPSSQGPGRPHQHHHPVQPMP